MSATAYRHSLMALRMNERIESVFDSLRKEVGPMTVPKEIAKEVRRKLKQSPEICGDYALIEIVAKKVGIC